jgi:chemotaxis protein methyltransferase CheR
VLTKLYFDILRDIIYKNTGIVFDEKKKYFIENRVKEHMEELGIYSLKDYIYKLKVDKNVLKDFISKITVNETYFYREYYHLKALAKLVQTENFGFPVKVLSIPCSTGEEPYSIAIILAEKFPHLAAGKAEILATDISQQAIQKGMAGRFTQVEVNRGLPVTLLVKYFKQQGAFWIINEKLKRMVRFKKMNLLNPFVGIGTFSNIFFFVS